MKYFVTFILLLSCFGFGQTNYEYTVEEILEHFSSNFDVKEMLYEKLYRPSRYPDGSWKLTEAQKASEYIWFSAPIKVHKPVNLETQLLNDEQAIQNLAKELAQEAQIEYGKALLWYEDSGFESSENLEFQKQELIQENFGGNLDKLYEKYLSYLNNLELNNNQNYYLLPVHYKKQHSGYIKVSTTLSGDLNKYTFEEVKISKYTSWQSLSYPHYPLRITSEKAQSIVGLSEEPMLIDLIDQRQGFLYTYINNVPNFNEHLYWLFDKGMVVINVKTGAQYEIQDSEGNPTSLLDITFDSSSAPYRFALPVSLELVQEAKYQHPPFQVRIIKNRRLIFSIIRVCIQVALLIFFIRWNISRLNNYKKHLESTTVS